MTSSCLVSRISKYEIRSRLSSAVNLMSGLSSFNISLKVFRLLSPEFQTIKQSSRYLFQLVKIYFPVSSSNVWLTFLYIVSSKYPRAKVAYVGSHFCPHGGSLDFSKVFTIECESIVRKNDFHSF